MYTTGRLKRNTATDTSAGSSDGGKVVALASNERPSLPLSAGRRQKSRAFTREALASMDERTADALIRAAQGVRLLGAEVVLSGIRPEVAQTLVSLGTDLGGVVTCGTLQSGIAYAMSELRRSRRPTSP